MEQDKPLNLRAPTHKTLFSNQPKYWLDMPAQCVHVGMKSGFRPFNHAGCTSQEACSLTYTAQKRSVQSTAGYFWVLLPSRETKIQSKDQKITNKMKSSTAQRCLPPSSSYPSTWNGTEQLGFLNIGSLNLFLSILLQFLLGKGFPNLDQP